MVSPWKGKKDEYEQTVLLHHFGGTICVPKLHTAHRNDLWWRARVWEESTRDQKTRSMLKREPRRSATSHSRQGKQHVFIITLPGWQTATTDWSYSNRKITVYRHETGNPHLFNTWITSLLWQSECFLANGPANFPSRWGASETHTHAPSPHVATLALCGVLICVTVSALLISPPLLSACCFGQNKHAPPFYCFVFTGH